MFYLIIKLIKHVQVQDQMEVQKLCISLCSTVEKKKKSNGLNLEEISSFMALSLIFCLQSK